MKAKIVFNDLKMEIANDGKVTTRFYGELMYVIYDAPYCLLHFTDDKKYRVEATMQFVLDNLPIAFIRCNRSVILNMCYYKEYDSMLMEVKMECGKHFKLSRRHLRNFKEARQSLPRISPPCQICYVCINEECKNRDVFYRCKKA